MSTFALDDKKFASMKAVVPKLGSTLEIRKLGSDYFIFSHREGSVEDYGSYTKEELKAIWQMLTVK
jgi:hypothetical protein